jgi:sigma-B regulation protein RsbU (phosphoserine phosphatase)
VAPAEEPERLEAVRRYAILDTPPDGAFGRVAALAARIFDVPIATVTIVDEDRIWFKAQQGLPQGVSEIDRDPGLCASAILQDETYVVTDALRDPRTAANPLVHGEPGVQFYAAAPITTSDGYRLGTVNILDTRSRQAAPEEPATLEDLAAVVIDELELRLSAMRTVQLERELRTNVEAGRERLAHLAGTLQRTLLPPVLPKVPGLEVAAHYQIASTDRVGGDFYDLFPWTAAAGRSSSVTCAARGPRPRH